MRNSSIFFSTKKAVSKTMSIMVSMILMLVVVLIVTNSSSLSSLSEGGISDFKLIGMIENCEVSTGQVCNVVNCDDDLIECNEQEQRTWVSLKDYYKKCSGEIEVSKEDLVKLNCGKLYETVGLELYGFKPQEVIDTKTTVSNHYKDSSADYGFFDFNTEDGVSQDAKLDLFVVEKFNYLKSTSGLNFERVVLHHTGGKSFKAAEDTLKKRGYGIHFMVDLDGTIVQYVSIDRKTSHACGANSKTVGIEIVNSGKGEDYTDEQYESVKNLLVALRQKVKTPAEPFVIAHSEVFNFYKYQSGCAKGKWDVSANFDWNRVGVSKSSEFLEKSCRDSKGVEGGKYFTGTCVLS